MFKYFDILFIRIYYQYIKWNDPGSPKLTSLLILSFFQSLNVFAIYFFIRGLTSVKSWIFTTLDILLVQISVLLIDYIRVFRIIGFAKLLSLYDRPEKRKVFLHPILYFILSILSLIVLRIFNLFPSSLH